MAEMPALAGQFIKYLRTKLLRVHGNAQIDGDLTVGGTLTAAGSSSGSAATLSYLTFFVSNGFQLVNSDSPVPEPFLATWEPSKLGTVAGVYLEAIGYVAAASGGDVVLYAWDGASWDEVGRVTIDAAAVNIADYLVRSADLYAAIGSSDCLIYVGFDTDAGAKAMNMNMIRLVIEVTA